MIGSATNQLMPSQFNQFLGAIALLEIRFKFNSLFRFVHSAGLKSIIYE